MLFMMAEQKDLRSSFQEIKLWKGGCRVEDSFKLNIFYFIIKTSLGGKICACVCLCVRSCGCVCLRMPLRFGNTVMGKEVIYRLLLFSTTLYIHPPSPPQPKTMFAPPKTALIQIKLNKVSAANPCVFRQLKHTPPSRMSGSSPLHLAPSPSALLSSCSAPGPWQKRQQALLWLSAPLPLYIMCVCVCVCVCMWTLCISLYISVALLFDYVYSLLLVLPLRQYVCM